MKIFKVLIIAAVLCLFTAVSAMAVGVLWTDPNPPQMGVTGYWLRWQEQGTAVVKKIWVDGYQNTQVTINDSNFTYGIVYDFWVTAVNSVGESDPSEVASRETPWPGGEETAPAAPGGIQFTTDFGPPIDNNLIVTE